MVELYVSCRDLVNMDIGSLSDPFLVLFKKVGHSWVEVGKTEIVWNNLNPDFAKTFELGFEFEKRQALKIECRDADDDRGTKYDTLGTAEFELGAVVGAKNSRATLDLVSKGKKMGHLLVKVEALSKKREVICLKLRAKDMSKYMFGILREDTYFTIWRTDKSRTVWTKVYQSENINSNDKACAEIALTKDKFCGGDLSTPLKVSRCSYEVHYVWFILLLESEVQRRVSYEHERYPRRAKEILVLQFKIGKD